MNTELLTTGFDFYHLGHVTAAESPPLPAANDDELADKVGVAFSLQGDVRAVILSLFDQGLDLSTYAEIGNVIASRFADSLSSERRCDVILSPPKILESSALERLLAASPSTGRRSYLHHVGNAVIQFEVRILNV